ncbi:MAG: putative rane protein [Fibrobacteres bacterium]|nr:putative rane protein [Fibrobacterota bacterium]
MIPPARDAVGRARARKKLIWFWLRLVAAVCVLWWVIEKNGRGRIMGTLLSAKPGWVALAALFFFLSVVAGAYQWYLLLRMQGIGFGYRACFRTYYSGMFLNNFLPGTVGGDALRVYEVKKGSDGWGKAVASTFLDRLIGFFTLSLLSLIAVGIALFRNTLDQSVFRHLLYAVGLVFAIFVIVLVLLLSRRIASLVHALIHWTGMKWLEEAHARMQDILLAYRSRWVEMSFVILVSCVVQILRIDVHWFSALGLGVRISPVFFFCFIPVIALAGVIPLNVGGWGIPQSIGTYLYTLPGVLAPLAVAGIQAYSANAAVPGAAGQGIGGDLNVTAAALAFLPSVIGLVVMLGGGFYFVRGRSAVAAAETSKGKMQNAE